MNDDSECYKALAESSATAPFREITPAYRKETQLSTTTKAPNVYEQLRTGITLMGTAVSAQVKAETFFAELSSRATAIKNSIPAEIERELSDTWKNAIGPVPAGFGRLIQAFGEFCLLDNNSKFTDYYRAFTTIMRVDATKVADVFTKFKTQRGAFNAFVALTKPAAAVATVQTPAEVSAELQKKALATSKGVNAVLASVQTEIIAGRMTDDGKAYLESLVAAGKTAAMLLQA